MARRGLPLRPPQAPTLSGDEQAGRIDPPPPGAGGDIVRSAADLVAERSEFLTIEQARLPGSWASAESLGSS